MSDYRPKDDDLLEMWNHLKNAKELSGYVDMMIAIDVVQLVKEVERLREKVKWLELANIELNKHPNT